MNNKRYLVTAIHAAIEAGNAILQVYQSADFKIEEKADRSPLTLADMRSHEIIVDRLVGFEIPILSEEGQCIPYEEREVWETFFLIDPLDGTKEFIKKNGEFTVNIALIRDEKPVGGVIFVPDKDILYFASAEIGSYKLDISPIADWLNNLSGTRSRFVNLSNSQIDKALSELIAHSAKLPIKPPTNRPYTIAGSRSHSTAELEDYVKKKREQYGEVEFISAGSSLKLCLVAEGRADIYPRTGPTMEWDTAAGQAIVENAGGKVFQYDTENQLVYNKENLLNPWFVALKSS